MKNSSADLPIKTEADALAKATDLPDDLVLAVEQIVHSEAMVALDEVGILDHVTFQGGSCIARCYGGIRLSEDLDFSSSRRLGRDDVTAIGDRVLERLEARHGAKATASARGIDGSHDPQHPLSLAIKFPISTNKALPHVTVKLDFDSRPVHDATLALNQGPLDRALGWGRMPMVSAKSPTELVADKIVAAGLTDAAGRSNPRARDAFDICWLVNHEEVDLGAVRDLVFEKEMELGATVGTALDNIDGFVSQLRSRDHLAARQLSGMVWEKDVAVDLSTAEGAEQLVRDFEDIVDEVAIERRAARDRAER